MSISITEIMTEQVITLPPTASLYEAQHTMREHRIRHIPICDGEHKLVGLLSQRDVLAAIGPLAQDETGAEHEQRAKQLPIDQCMTTKVLTIQPQTGVKQAALMLERRKFGCLPVVNGGEKLIGLVTSSDFVAVAINLLETLESGEPDF